MSNHDAVCPECSCLLRHEGPSGNPWEQQILCPGCSSIYHVSCTIVGDEEIWHRLGDFNKMWKCKTCFTSQSEEYTTFSEHLGRLKQGDSMKTKKEETSPTESGLEESCGECSKSLRDINGRLIRRLQCPRCLNAFHFSCTDIGDEGVWQRFGQYRNTWTCKQCTGFNDTNNFTKKLKEVKQSLDIPIDTL